MSKEAAGEAFEVENGPLKVLHECLYGGMPEANMLPKLLHLHQSDPRSVLAALSERANATVANADSGLANAQRAGATLVNAARFLDEKACKEESKDEPMIVEVKLEEGEPEKKKVAPAYGAGVCKALLDHVLLLTGSGNRAAKDRSVRAMGCALVAALVPCVPGHHSAAEAKLREFALDRVPAIRERAVRGLSQFAGSPATEQALVSRATDPCTAVRASAVRALRPSRTTAPALLGRLDDAEAVVRAQMFHRLAEQPAAVEELGPAVLARLVAGLKDRSSMVRSAAGLAVDAWHAHLGGALALLARCDVLSDESLGEAAAAALSARYTAEGRVQAKQLLGRGARDLPGPEAGPAAPLLARVAASLMQEEDRDEVVDIPALVARAKKALQLAQRQDAGDPLHGFVLRQLLHVLVGVDVSICDEQTRLQMEGLAEAVLQTAPLGGSRDALRQRSHTSVDLGVVLLRKCCGLGQGLGARTSRSQALEARCSSQVVLLVSDLCESAGTGDGADGFASQLSVKLQELNTAVEECTRLKVTLAARKAKAVQDEEFIEAQKLKEAIKRNTGELAVLEEQRDRLQKERDGVCLRVLAILNALLRWTSSDLRRDPALHGALDQILVPMMGLPALSDEVELATITAICLFSERDGALARRHWSLLLELLRGLRQAPTDGSAGLHVRARAGIAARALADCARLHGVEGGYLDRDEVISAGCALAAVPFAARQVAVEPLCGCLLNLGHVFFEEHLREPVLEVQWALGWMLVEVFTRSHLGLEDECIQDGTFAAKVEPKVKVAKDEPGVEKKVEQLYMALSETEDGVESVGLAARLAQFFAVLPKLPGKHGAPLLSLAVESAAESGLWRRAALMPKAVGAQTRWSRSFSWPQLFDFAHSRLPADMRLRLWRCSLQLCVTEPALASLAEIPFALAAAAADAPPGATELLYDAFRLGADPVALAPLGKALGGAPRGTLANMLSPQAEAKAAESQRRAALAELGVDVDAWAPADVPVPDVTPPQHRMRIARGISRSGSSGDLRQAGPGPVKRIKSAVIKEEEEAEAVPEPEAHQEVEERISAQPTPHQVNGKKRRKIDWIAKEQDQSAEIRLPISDAAAA